MYSAVKTDIIHLEYNEAVLLIKALNRHKHKTKVAAGLAVSRHKLMLLMKKYAVEKKDNRFFVTWLPVMTLKPGLLLCAPTEGIKIKKFVKDKTLQN